MVHQTLTPMLAYAEHIRADAQITDIVNIGIGGSDLGPLMAVLALDSFAYDRQAFAFCLQRRWPRAGGSAEKPQSRKHAVLGGLKNLHHH